MKEFKKSLLIVILWQIIGWSIFAFCDEVIPHIIPNFNPYNTFEQYLLAIIFIVATPILYLIYSKKIVTKNNYNSKKFNVSFLILWTLFSIALGFGIGEYKPKDYSRWLDGLQYLEFAIGLILQVVVVVIVKIIDFIYKFIKNKIKES